MKLPELTDNELGLMKELWRRGRASAREIHEAMGPKLNWSYSTTRTVLERMTKKGLLEKTSFHGLFLYNPAISRVEGLARFVHAFARDILETGPAPVVSLLADSKTLTPEELDDLARLLDETEERA